MHCIYRYDIDSHLPVFLWQERFVLDYKSLIFTMFHCFRCKNLKLDPVRELLKIVGYDNNIFDVKKKSKLQDLIHIRLGHKYIRLFVPQPASGDCD